MALEARTNPREYSLAQARALLILAIVLAHQIYETTARGNPLGYVGVAIVILSALVIVAIGVARAQSYGGFSRACVFGLAIPWLIAVSYVIYGLFQVGGVLYGLIEFHNYLGKMIRTWDFWILLVTSLIRGSFWTVLGNSLRKNISGLVATGSVTLKSSMTRS